MPRGRVKGSRNKKTIARDRYAAALAADEAEIVAKVIEAAKAGDPEARRLFFRYVRSPPSHETFVRPTEYTIPQTVEEARGRLLELGERMMRGEIGIEAYEALVSGLRAYLGDRAAEQQRELDMLKDTLRGGGAS
jgi:hypothetical protein